MALNDLESHRVNRDSPADRLAKIEKLIPKLLSEMRRDLIDYPLVRELFALRMELQFNPPPRSVLVYYINDHDQLESKLQILENLNLILVGTPTPEA